MTSVEPLPSARRTELLERAYEYALVHGLGDLSLRPLAAAVGSSPRVLLFLFDSKEGLIRALLGRARADELELLAQAAGTDLSGTADLIWGWLAAPGHRTLLALWLEGYARSLIDENGPWAGFAAATVADWLAVLAAAQPAGVRRTAAGRIQRTAVLAVLRGAMLDLLATGDERRTTAAVRIQLRALAAAV